MKSIFALLFLAFFFTGYSQPTAPSQRPASSPVAEAMEPAEAQVTAARVYMTQLSEWLDKYEAQLKAQTPPAKGTDEMRSANLNMSKSNLRTMGTPINTSRSNIKTLSKKMDDLGTVASDSRGPVLADVSKALTDLNTSVTELYDAIIALGQSHASKAVELKTRHDAVKNAIQNMR